MNKNGWSEITTKHFNIISFHKHALNLTVKNWVDNNNRLRLKKGMRIHCACCKVSWGKIKGMTNCIMTDKGNQVVCDDCFDKLGGNII